MAYLLLLCFWTICNFRISESIIFSWVLPNQPFISELTGENGLALGKLNFLTTNAIFWSFLYRFTRDWFLNRSLIDGLKQKNDELLRNRVIVKNACKQFFIIKKRGENIILKTEDIIYFKAQGDFVLAIDNQSRKYIVNDSLKSIYGMLDSEYFFQINRGEIINFNYFEAYKPYIKNRLAVYLNNTDTVLYSSNSRTPKLRSWINNR